MTMLFLFAMLNPDVGYRQVCLKYPLYCALNDVMSQGMHELLAVCLLVVDRDSLEITPSNADTDPLAETSANAVITQVMRTTLDRRYIEHDSFELFQQIMKSAKPFYEWRAEEGIVRHQSLEMC